MHHNNYIKPLYFLFKIQLFKLESGNTIGPAKPFVENLQ